MPKDTQPQTTLAEELADLTVSRYLVSQVLETDEPGHTLVRAAKKCGCGRCVGDYINMVDFITQGDEKWSNKILESNEVKRPKRLSDWE